MFHTFTNHKFVLRFSRQDFCFQLNVKIELWGNWKLIAKKTKGQSCIIILK